MVRHCRTAACPVTESQFPVTGILHRTFGLDYTDDVMRSFELSASCTRYARMAPTRPSRRVARTEIDEDDDDGAGHSRLRVEAAPTEALGHYAARWDVTSHPRDVDGPRSAAASEGQPSTASKWSEWRGGDSRVKFAPFSRLPMSRGAWRSDGAGERLIFRVQHRGKSL